MGTTSYRSTQATVVTRNAALRWLAASPFLVKPLSIVAAATVSPRFVGATMLSFIVGGLLSGLVYLINPWPKRDRSGVEASYAGLTTAAGLSIPRRDFAQGALASRADGAARVLLERKGVGSSIAVDLPSVDEGRSLLEAMGLDPAHSVATFRGMSRVYASRGGFYANTALLFGGPASLGWLAARTHVPAFGLLAMFVAVFAYITFFMPTRVDVGSDGIVVSWYWSKRFIPYADIVAVDETAGVMRSIRAVVLTRRDGERTSLPLAYGLLGRAHAAAERICAGLAAYGRGDDTGEAAFLARGARSTADWIVALRQIGTGANAGPRTAPIAAGTLWRIVEAVGEKASVRAAAAVALARTLAEPDRARLATIAEGTTAPRLRIALETATTSDDDAAIAEALTVLEAEEGQARS